MPSAFYNMNDEMASGLFYKMPVFRSDFRVIDDNMLHLAMSAFKTLLREDSKPLRTIICFGKQCFVTP